MKKKILMICDREAEYACRFMEYVNEREDSLFLALACTDYRELSREEDGPQADILLYSAFLPREGIRRERYGLILLLGEEGYTEETEYPVFCKYQSADRLLRRCLEMYAERAGGGFGMFLRDGRMKILGVYSPVGRSGRTDLALTLGKELAVKKKTLYLNLEEYAGFETLYPSGEEGGLSELLYFLEQGKKAFACRLAGMVRELDGLSYIPPLRSLTELRNTDRRIWMELLDALDKGSDYEIVILDLGSAVAGLFDLLERCDKIYSLVCGDENARAKWKQYEKELIREGYKKVLEKTKKVEERPWEENGKSFSDK